MTKLHRLSTSHGAIVVEEAGRGDLPVLLIHGNWLSREVFRKRLGVLSRKYRLLACDLPGHGDSGDALDASRTYTRPGLADAATEMLGLLGQGKLQLSAGRSVVISRWKWQRNFPASRDCSSAELHRSDAARISTRNRVG